MGSFFSSPNLVPGTATPAAARKRTGTGNGRHRQHLSREARRLLIGGGAAFVVLYGAAMGFLFLHLNHPFQVPLDLDVYLRAGKVARHATPYYDSSVSSPLYDWPAAYLPFTYSPFAALVFALLSLLPAKFLALVWIQASVIALLLTVWVTLRSLGTSANALVGGTLLISAIMLWTNPVLTELSLGQIELPLMALVMWDMCLPDERRWKGIGLGVAAGIKLVPLIFILYLLLTRRIRAAIVALASFAATIMVGFLAMPSDSLNYWFHGVFLQGSRTGLISDVTNQSLDAMISRLAGSVAAGQAAALAIAALVMILGLLTALALRRAGHETVA